MTNDVASAAKQTLLNVGESLFPGIAVSYENAGNVDNNNKVGNEVVASLPLQVTLFLNVCYFPFWLLVVGIVACLKYDHLNYLYKFILVTVLVGALIIELARLYLGYLGNLNEKVPELAGFWLLSILLQLPLQGFLFFNEDLILLPMERAANFIMISMLVSELVIGFFALRVITRHQAKKFHLAQMKMMEQNKAKIA